MDELQESAFVMQPGNRIFSHFPIELLCLVFVVGAGVTAFYPSIPLKMEAAGVNDFWVLMQYL